MSNDSRDERERLKKEYKEHYRKVREIKERLSVAQKKKNISDALKNMDTAPLMETFDDFLFTIKSKVANVEARLDVALDSLMQEDDYQAEELKEELHKAEAKETLKQVKMEMGLLYNEIERQADSMQVSKTIGNKDQGSSSPVKESLEDSQ